MIDMMVLLRFNEKFFTFGPWSTSSIHKQSSQIQALAVDVGIQAILRIFSSVLSPVNLHDIRIPAHKRRSSIDISRASGAYFSPNYDSFLAAKHLFSGRAREPGTAAPRQTQQSLHDQVVENAGVGR